jgi:hypothetical protein
VSAPSDSLDLNEQTLDALDSLSLQPDSFVSLASDGLYVLPVPHAPPPHYCYIQVRDHVFVPASNVGQCNQDTDAPRAATFNTPMLCLRTSFRVQKVHGTPLPDIQGRTGLAKLPRLTTLLPGIYQIPLLLFPNGWTAQAMIRLVVRV